MESLKCLLSSVVGEAIGVIVPAEAREQLITLLDDILHPPDVRTRALSSDVVSNYIEKGMLVTFSFS